MPPRPGGEPAGEAVHQVQVRDGVEGEPAVQVIQRLVQQPAGAASSGIGDQEPDVEVAGRGQQARGPARVAEVDGHGPVADAVGAGQGLAQSVELAGGAGGEDEIEAGCRELAGEGFPDAGGGAGNDGPRAIGRNFNHVLDCNLDCDPKQVKTLG